MSIINQTLRELDARQPDPASPQAPLRPATAKRRSARLWGVVVVPLLLTGLAIGYVSWPAVEHPPLPHAGTAQSQMPADAQSVPRPQPVAPSVAPHAPSLTKAVAAPVVAEIRIRSTDSSAGKKQPVPAGSHKRPSPPSTMGLSDPAVAAQPPAIRKEVSQPTAQEKADERYHKALALIRANQAEQARPLLEEALELSPGHVAARETLAALLSDAGLNQEAEKVLRIGWETNPEHAWFALSLARLQAARGDTNGAVATLRSGIGGRGVSAEYHATLAALLVRLRQYPDAARQYEQALRLQPGQGTWWMGLGLSLEAQGKNDEARSAYRRALMAGNLPDKLGEFVRAKLVD